MLLDDKVTYLVMFKTAVVHVYGSNVSNRESLLIFRAVRHERIVLLYNNKSATHNFDKQSQKKT